VKTTTSRTLFERASRILPGGVDSPVRAFKSVGGTPLFVTRGSGATIEDVDGNRFIDYVMSWGPLIHGHAPRGLVKAIGGAAKRGTSFGAPSPLEHRLGELVRTLMPSMERVRFVSSGTEAAMSAVRVARAFTRRDRIIKFEGCYHGHADAFLVKAGSGATTLGIPTSPGVPAAVTNDTLLARYNDLASVAALCDAQSGKIAAVIVEPIAGNMGLVPPVDGFLSGLRDLCSRHGILLVFDEVISGFRASAGGAQAIFGIRPDLTCLGKIIGGGLPVGAYGGRADVMDHIAPSGPVYQAGTLSGNPLAMAAGAVTLDLLQRAGTYKRLDMLTARLHAGLLGATDEADVKVTINRVGSMITLFFTPGPVFDYASAKTSDTALFARFFHGLLARGIYFPPAQYEAAFVSLAHTESDIDATVRAAGEIFRELRA
jgi:glutamate-1-semialdehyde 2,1-aminomutase